MANKDILIVGAGPVGLTAAVELARRGHTVSIVDMREGPTHESRALAVNPRSLEILEACGATRVLLERGIKLRRLNFWEPPRMLFSLPIDKLDHRYNFMLSLPQAETEAVLIARLKTHGVEVGWSTELRELRATRTGNEAVLRTPDHVTVASVDIVIGADGAHSRVRKSLGIAFAGHRNPTVFGLADVRLNDPSPVEDEVNIYSSSAGIFGVLPMPGERFRFVADRPDAIAVKPDGFNVRQVDWKSDFHISYAQAETYQKGSVFIAGDAAHIHSPVGGRGMNLGIEDAATLAWAIHEDRAGEYTSMRWPVGREVLDITEKQTQALLSKSPIAKLMRRCVIPMLVKRNWVRRRVLPAMAGLASPTPPWLDETGTS